MTDPLRKHFHDRLKEIMAKIFVEYRTTVWVPPGTAEGAMSACLVEQL